MLRLARAAGLALALITASAGLRAAPEQEIDAASGLVIDQDWELVRAHCSGCHSTRLVAQNRGSRETWLGLIRWMQSSQGLWQFDAPTEGAILGYLERNYAPLGKHRRAPLAAALLPPRPAPQNP